MWIFNMFEGGVALLVNALGKSRVLCVHKKGVILVRHPARRFVAPTYPDSLKLVSPSPIIVVTCCDHSWHSHVRSLGLQY